jgi:energy-coupling factor transporter ATP-binding protein EcfA2
MMDGHILRADNVSQVWTDRDRSVAALHDVSVEFVSGGAHFLCGPSGAGKSTLGLLLAGLISPTHGKVQLNRVDVRECRSDVAFLFQFPESIFFAESVEKELGAVCSTCDEEDWNSTFDHLGISLQEIRHRHPFALSEGYARLTALAMQLARKPSVMILDEPTIGLDWKHQERVIHGLKDWIARDRLLITITHDLDLLSELRGSVFVFTLGHLAWSGPTIDLLNNDSLMRQSALRA